MEPLLHLQHLRQSSSADSPPLTLYVHLPWCVRKCPYCDFNSHEARGEIPARAYLQGLLADLDQALPVLAGRPFDSVFIGGGTPSLFAPDVIAELLEHLRRGPGLQPGAEITLEANPGVTDAGRFRGYADAGVNRLSLGVQSFDDQCLQALGRIHDAAQARRAAAIAVRIFANVNLDLMHGLPGQSPARAAADIRQALAFGPAHLSCYQLTLEPNTLFARYPPELPPEAELATIEQQVCSEVAAAGYHHYEVSAHASPGHECRHNRHYWEFADYLGIGAGAHSKLTAGGRVWREARVRVPGSYLRRVGTGAHVAERRDLGPKDRLAEFMMNALRLTDGFGLQLLRERTGARPADYTHLFDAAAGRGLLQQTGDRVAPTALGRRYLNRLISDFLPG